MDVPAPIADVFSLLTDPRRTPEWNPYIVEVTNLTYPISLGSTWRQVAMVAGRPMNLTCRVTKFEPPREGELQISGDQKGRTWTQCSEVDGRTRVTQGIDYQLPGGALGRIAGAFAREAIRRELQRTMERQRSAILADLGVPDGSGAE